MLSIRLNWRRASDAAAISSLRLGYQAIDRSGIAGLHNILQDSTRLKQRDTVILCSNAICLTSLYRDHSSYGWSPSTAVHRPRWHPIQRLQKYGVCAKKTDCHISFVRDPDAGSILDLCSVQNMIACQYAIANDNHARTFGST